MWIVYKIVDTLENKPVWVGVARNIEKANQLHFSTHSLGRKDRFTADNEDGRYSIEKINEYESRLTSLIHKDTWDLRLGLNKRYRKIDFRTMVSLNNANWLVSLTPEERLKFDLMKDKSEIKIPCIVCGKLVKKKSMLGHMGNLSCKLNKKNNYGE